MLLLHLSDRTGGEAQLGELRGLMSDKKEDFKLSPVHLLAQVLLESGLLLRRGEGTLEEN